MPNIKLHCIVFWYNVIDYQPFMSTLFFWTIVLEADYGASCIVKGHDCKSNFWVNTKEHFFLKILLLNITNFLREFIIASKLKI